MDGVVAPLDKICDLADKYDAMVMIDECHATGFIGATGKGTLEAKGVMGSRYYNWNSGKALGAWVDIPLLKKKLLNYYANVLDPIYFQILAPAIVELRLKF
jgi:glycine C-acetyltransferase